MSARAIEAGNAFVRIWADDKEARRAFNRLKTDVDQLAGGLSSVGAKFTAAGAAMAAPFILATRVFTGFQSEMARVRAVSAATSTEFAQLSAKARQLGADTTFTASQVARGMGYMAQAGYDAQQILAGIPDILNLARAGMMDLGRTADIATDIGTAFRIPAESIGRVTDVIAKAASTSNTNVDMMGDSFRYAAAAAAASGQSLEEMAAAIATLAGNGIKASMAGTSLRMMLSKLSEKDTVDSFRAMGVEVATAEGRMRPLLDIMRELEAAFGGLTDVERTARYFEIFGERAGNAALALSGSGAAAEQFRRHMAHAAGATAEMARIMDDTLFGKIQLFLSAAEGTAIAVGQALEPLATVALEVGADLANAARAVVEFAPGLTTAAAGAVALATGIGAVALGAGVAVKAVTSIAGSVAAAGAAGKRLVDGFRENHTAAGQAAAATRALKDAQEELAYAENDRIKVAASAAQKRQSLDQAAIKAAERKAAAERRYTEAVEREAKRREEIRRAELARDQALANVQRMQGALASGSIAAMRQADPFYSRIFTGKYTDEPFRKNFVEHAIPQSQQAAAEAQRAYESALKKSEAATRQAANASEALTKADERLTRASERAAAGVEMTVQKREKLAAADRKVAAASDRAAAAAEREAAAKNKAASGGWIDTLNKASGGLAKVGVAAGAVSLLSHAIGGIVGHDTAIGKFAADMGTFAGNVAMLSIGLSSVAKGAPVAVAGLAKVGTVLGVTLAGSAALAGSVVLAAGAVAGYFAAKDVQLAANIAQTERNTRKRNVYGEGYRHALLIGDDFDDPSERLDHLRERRKDIPRLFAEAGRSKEEEKLYTEAFDAVIKATEISANARIAEAKARADAIRVATGALRTATAEAELSIAKAEAERAAKSEEESYRRSMEQTPLSARREAEVALSGLRGKQRTNTETIAAARQRLASGAEVSPEESKKLQEGIRESAMRFAENAEEIKRWEERLRDAEASVSSLSEAHRRATDASRRAAARMEDIRFADQVGRDPFAAAAKAASSLHQAGNEYLARFDEWQQALRNGELARADKLEKELSASRERVARAERWTENAGSASERERDRRRSAADDAWGRVQGARTATRSTGEALATFGSAVNDDWRRGVVAAMERQAEALCAATRHAAITAQATAETARLLKREADAQSGSPPFAGGE